MRFAATVLLHALVGIFTFCKWHLQVCGGSAAWLLCTCRMIFPILRRAGVHGWTDDVDDDDGQYRGRAGALWRRRRGRTSFENGRQAVQAKTRTCVWSGAAACGALLVFVVIARVLVCGRTDWW